MELNRAYALWQVKALDKESRQITGLATSPEPDRVGDIIEPHGVKFTNPLPLLLYHDKRLPVGDVTFNKATDTGITFTAHFPEITEPGPLRDRVEEAWQSVKAGLIKGVSIGFRVLDDGIELLRSGGIRFTALEVLELSLVTVPANQQARIATIKSFAAQQTAAFGGRARASSHPGVPGPHTSTAMTLGERLTQAKGDLKTKTTDLLALVDLSDGEGLDEAQSTQRDTLTEEIKSLTTRIESLDTLERASALSARTVIVKEPTLEAGSRARDGAEHSVITFKGPETPPGIGFARMAICKMASLLSQGESSPLDIARLRYKDDPRIAMTLKAAVAAGTATHATWAGPLVDPANLANEFIEYLRPRTIIGQFGTNGIPSLNRVPFNVRITGSTSGGSAWWVGEGKLKPLTKFDFNAVTLLWAKVASMAVISDELARFSSPSAEEQVRRELSAAVIARIDTDFIDPDVAPVAGVSPGSITYGAQSIAPSGTDAAAVLRDFNRLMAEYIQANQDPASTVLIMPTTVALSLSLMQNALGQQSFPGIGMKGGSFQGLPVIVSQYAATSTGASPNYGGNIVALVNCNEIFLADDGGVSVMASREASIEMSDAPESETGTVVSMFQSNQIALLAERYINWARRRSTAVVYVRRVEWGGAQSPAA